MANSVSLYNGVLKHYIPFFWQAAGVLIDKLKVFGSEVQEASKNVGQGIVEGSGKVVDKVKDEMSGRPLFPREILNAIKNIGSEFASGSSAVLDQLKVDIEKSTTVDEVKQVIAKAQESIRSTVQSGLSHVQTGYDDLRGSSSI